MENNIISQIKGEILFITINRESKLNALNKATLKELSELIFGAQTQNHIGGIIITGKGEKAFVAGADISEFANFSAQQAKELAKDGHKNVFNLIENSAKPIIAAINGFALGGGLELALACHIRIAAENAKLGLPETSLGIIPGYGGTQRLSQLLGKGKALEMILSAEMINANEAEKIGLVNQVVSQENLISTTEKLMLKILSRSPEAISSAIKAINASTTNKGFETEIDEFSQCFSTQNFNEGISAFLEKRPATFRRK